MVHTGFVVNMFAADRSEPRWSVGPGNRTYVQDRQGQVRSHGSKLDSKVCHVLKIEATTLCNVTNNKFLYEVWWASQNGKKLKIIKKEEYEGWW